MGNKGKEEQRTLKAVIFDVDGTLVDSNDLHVEAWREAFADYGIEASAQEIHPHIGKGGDQLMPEFVAEEQLKQFGKELEEHRVKLFQEKYLERAKPFPKVRDLFERIKADNLQIVLASSSTEPEVEKHKENLNIKDLVASSTSADDADESKPSPDIFEAALKTIKNIEPNEAIIIGDSPWDVIAGKKAGMQTIGVLSGGFSEDELRTVGAVEIYKDVSELLANYERSYLKKRSSISADSANS